jgi:hypothetical protein
MHMTSKTRRGGSAAKERESVTVIVVVGHDQLHRGEVGEVDLTDDVRAKLDRGYLRLAEPHETDAAPPLGGTPAPVPGGSSLLGVTPADTGTTSTTTTSPAVAQARTTGGPSATGGAGNSAG